MDIQKIIDIILETKQLIQEKQLTMHIKTKGAADFVTDVDTSVQRFLQQRLKSEYPDIQFVGEEGEGENIDYTGRVWVLDPIDGTTNLIHDFAMSAVSLALYENGEGVLGIMYNPFHDEMFWAKKGCGAYFNGSKITVSNAKTLDESLVGIGTSPYDKQLADNNFKIFCELFKKTQDIRRTGSAAIDLCYVACGRLDGYFERNLKPWDFAAGNVILTEAGGCVSNILGEAVGIRSNSDIIADNGHIHYDFMRIIIDD